MRHFTKDKGDLAVAKVTADLHEKGYIVFTPTFSEHVPFDIIVLDEGMKMRRVQVKFRHSDKNKKLTIALCNTASNSNGFYKKMVNTNEFDGYAIYCDQTNDCYYVRMSDVKDRVTFTMSLTESKGKNAGTHRFVENYKNPNSLYL